VVLAAALRRRSPVIGDTASSAPHTGHVDWLSALGGVIVGSVLTAVVDRVGARRNAERGEQGRVREESRQRLSDIIRRFHAQVSTALTPSMAPHPFSFESRLGFACAVESELAHLDDRTCHAMRGYLAQLVGPLRARVGQRLAHIPPDQYTATMEAEAFMESARGMAQVEINDAGLLGAAGEARESHEAEIQSRDAAARLLSEMASSLKSRA